MKNAVFLLFFCTPYALCIFDYDRAVSAAHKEQWQEAGQQFKKVVAEQPNRPEVLYDAGVVAFNNEDYDQAKAFFESAAQNESASRDLKERAYFNKGNTHVKKQELKEALLSYEQTLMLNSENEQAKHNHDTVKKMLDQQQQQQKQQQDKKDQDQQQDQQDDQQQDEQEKEDNKDCCSQDEQSQKGDEQEKESSSSDDSQEAQRDEQKQSDQAQEGKDDRFDEQGDQQDEEERRPDQQKQDGQQDDQRDTRDDFEKDSQKDEQQEQQEQQFDHDKSSGETHDGAQDQDMQDEQKEQELGDQGQEEPVDLDPQLKRVLSKRENRDAELNKQLIRALVGQEMAGKDGQNCW